jgi:hypothetical protein
MGGYAASAFLQKKAKAFQNERETAQSFHFERKCNTPVSL